MQECKTYKCVNETLVLHGGSNLLWHAYVSGLPIHILLPSTYMYAA